MDEESIGVAQPDVARKVARYPGVQPFGDDDIHRHIFKGRDAEQYELLQMVLAERLVLLFARSGVGKSSLINAGLLQPLRSKKYFPLVVRISGSKANPLENLYDGIKAAVVEAGELLGIEFEPADETQWNKTTLWHFFKTFQIWRNNQLLTPVLIIDQFEELFTLFTRRQRAKLIFELADVVRGIRPDLHGAEIGERLSDMPPEVKVVLALREDYYANLEELRQRIPAIYKTALRLNPLTQEQARAAIVEPAALESADYATPAFTWSEEALAQILDFLCEQQLGEGRTAQGDQVEPFQLQLICQHFEAVVREQKLDTVSRADIGGEHTLKQILSHFYEGTLDKICEKFADENDLRKKLESLCEYGFITARGRRLLREESTIKEEDGIAPEILREMVELRLLRKEPRVGDNYYELTHDTLIEPIQLSRQKREKREADEAAAREARERRRRNLRFGIGAVAMLGVAVVAIGVLQYQARNEIQMARQEAKKEVGIAHLQRKVAVYKAETTTAQAKLTQLADQALRANQQLRLVEEVEGDAEETKRQRELVQQNLAATLEKISEEEKRAQQVLVDQQAAHRELVQLEQQTPDAAREMAGQEVAMEEAGDDGDSALVAIESADTPPASAEPLVSEDSGAAASVALGDFDELSICEQIDVLRDENAGRAADYGLNVEQRVARLSELDALLEHSAMVVTQNNMIISATGREDASEPEARELFRQGEEVWLYIWFSSPGEQTIEIEYVDGNGNPVSWGEKQRKSYDIGANRLQGERLGYRVHTYRNARAAGPQAHQFRVYSSDNKLLCRRTFSVED